MSGISANNTLINATNLALFPQTAKGDGRDKSCKCKITFFTFSKIKEEGKSYRIRQIRKIRG